jgi:GNAT superfamily N-acetyltransferase
MKWPTAGELGALITLPEGYRFEFLRRADVQVLAAGLARWHPDIAIGGGSCYLRETFYADQVFFEGGPDRDVMVVVFVQGQDVVGMWSIEKEPDSLTLYARLIVIDPKHRSAKLASNVMPIAESVGRAMGAGLIFGAATLKIPHMQHALETVGWQFVGFSSGYDQEMVSPGVVKRVFEAVYCKVLVPEEDLVQPDPKNLTPRARALWEAISRDTAPSAAHRP